MSELNYTYILECKDGTYYTGWTNNLEKRLKDLIPGIENTLAICFTLRRIMLFEPFKDIRQAMEELEQMKALRRKRIIRLAL